MTAKYEEIMKAKGFLPYNLHTLPAKFIQKAKEELGETDEIRRTALEHFRKRILEDKKLRMYAPTDDAYLIQFLRARKYDVDKAMGLIHNYLNIIISNPGFFDKLDKEKMFKFLSSGFVNVLPFRDNDGCLVVIIKMVFHGDNTEEIHKYISKEVLPQEYGGDYTSYNDGDLVTKEMDKTYDKFSMLIGTCFS